MPRGGRRSGRVGTAYGNRTDLQGGSKPLPVTTMKGQPYGAATAQADAQQALPMAGTPLPAMPQQAQAAPPPSYATPDDAPNLSDPTARPDEHVLSGAPVGPGDGPVPPVVATYTNARDFLTSALAGPVGAGNSEAAFLLQQLQARGV